MLEVNSLQPFYTKTLNVPFDPTFGFITRNFPIALAQSRHCVLIINPNMNTLLSRRDDLVLLGALQVWQLGDGFTDDFE